MSAALHPPALGFTAAGRADLVRALALGGRESLVATAELLGFEAREVVVPAEEPVDARARPASIPVSVPTPAPVGFLPVPFWRVVAREGPGGTEPEARPAPATRARRPLEPADLEPKDAGRGRETEPIVSWPRLWRVLDDRLRTPYPRRAIDVKRLVARWARGELVVRLPRLAGLAHARVAMVLDRSERLQPFWADQVEVARRLARRLGRGSVRLARAPRGGGEPPLELAVDERLLVLGDLGLYGEAEDRDAWEKTGSELRRAGGSMLVLVPCPAHRWPGATARLWSAVDWGSPPRGTRLGKPVDPEQESVAEQVLRLASAAMRLEPGLVRAFCRLVEGADLATEVEVWSHEAVVERQAVGIVLDSERARLWQRELCRLPAVMQTGVVAALTRWHARAFPEIWAAELGNLLGLGLAPEVVGQGAAEAACEMLLRVATLVRRKEASGFGLEIDGFFHRFGAWGSASIWKHPGFRMAFGEAFAALQQRYREVELPAGITPEMLVGADADLPPRRFALWHETDKLRLRPAGEPGQGSPLAEIWARARVTLGDGIEPARELGLQRDAPAIEWPRKVEALELVSDVETVRLERLSLPEWASTIGRDEYGLWAAFEVEGLEQRMRWIAPGRFWMGSPESEEGRWHDEGPRHEVVLTEGFWLAETLCTQALWEAVMGSNPSRFKGAERPVESVSWDECQRFLEKVNGKHGGTSFRLPTEAQWEYACRAGTETATWIGDLSTLREIAWYSENSGGETHPVGLKPANPWGLCDMLGNMEEWCWDWKGDYSVEASTDPKGPQQGADRVVRGGSWVTIARGVRAACRYWYHPSVRHVFLGFRLSRGPELRKAGGAQA